MISYNVLDSIIWFCIPLRDKAKKKQKNKKTSYPLRSAPQRFTLAHQAPGESLLLAGGCGGFSQGWGEAGRWFSGMSDGWTDRWMDRWMDGPDSSVVCIVSVSTHVTFIWTAICILACFYPVAQQFSNSVVTMG